jgi:hypothetical protein
MTSSPKRLDRIDIGILSQLQQNAPFGDASAMKVIVFGATGIGGNGVPR